MNLKVANLIAVQFGVFLGIMSWLAYSHLPFAGPGTAAKTQESTAEPAATVAPVFKSEDQRSQAVDYRADREEAQPVVEQPAPAVHEYSAAAVQQSSALAAKQYYQQIAPRRYASSGLENGSIAADASSYTEVAQEPEVVPDYPASQTVAYVPSTQFIAYPQPQFVLFSNRHRFANRCRSTPPVIGTPMASTHRCPDRGQCQPNGGGVVSRQNASALSCQPAQGFTPRGHR
jgi:hypothetical protein